MTGRKLGKKKNKQSCDNYLIYGYNYCLWIDFYRKPYVLKEGKATLSHRNWEYL